MLWVVDGFGGEWFVVVRDLGFRGEYEADLEYR